MISSESGIQHGMTSTVENFQLTDLDHSRATGAPAVALALLIIHRGSLVVLRSRSR